MKPVIHATQLEAKVVGRNWLNSVINENHPKWLAAMKPFVGKVIYKADGKLRAEVRAALPDEVKDADQCVYLAGSGALRAQVRYVAYYVNRNDKAHPWPYYADDCIRLGDVRDSVLVALADPVKLEENYEVAGVIYTRKKLTELEREVSELEGELRHFGRFDS